MTAVFGVAVFRVLRNFGLLIGGLKALGQAARDAAIKTAEAAAIQNIGSKAGAAKTVGGLMTKIPGIGGALSVVSQYGVIVAAAVKSFVTTVSLTAIVNTVMIGLVGSAAVLGVVAGSFISRMFGGRTFGDMLEDKMVSKWTKDSQQRLEVSHKKYKDKVFEKYSNERIMAIKSGDINRVQATDDKWHRKMVESGNARGGVAGDVRWGQLTTMGQQETVNQKITAAQLSKDNQVAKALAEVAERQQIIVDNGVKANELKIQELKMQRERDQAEERRQEERLLHEQEASARYNSSIYIFGYGR